MAVIAARPLRRRLSREAATGWLFALPVLAYFLVWVFVPILAALGLTFVDWNGMAPLSEARFVGLDNVRQLLYDRAFLGSFRNTFTYTPVVVSGGTVLGMLLALAVNGLTRFTGLVRAVYFAPVMLPGTAMACSGRCSISRRTGCSIRSSGRSGCRRATGCSARRPPSSPSACW